MAADMSSHAVGRAWPVPAALLVAWALVAWRSGPPAPLGADAEPERFSAERAAQVHARVFPEGVPHPSGTPAHAAVLAAIRSELEALGLQVEQQDALVHSGNRLTVVRNLLASVRGREPGAGVLLVAHSDSVGAGPGAADDGAGVVTLLETARALTAGKLPGRDVLLLFTDAEEDGLLGARAFCSGHPWLQRVGVVLNFEARGTGGPSMLFQTGGPNRWLLEVAAEALDRPWTSSVADLVYNAMPNDTDLSVFIERGHAAINFAFIEGLARYHTPRDDLAHLERGSLQHHGDSALALTRAFAARELDSALGQVPAGEPAGDAVFFDLLSLGIVAWPSGWSPALALGVAALGAGALARAFRRAREAGTGLGLGVAALLGALLLAVSLGSAGPFLVGRLRGLPYPGLAHPWTLELATWGGVLAALALLAPRAPSAERGEAAFFGLWLLYALGALATAFGQPALVYLFLIPAALAALGALLFPRHLPRVEVLAALVTGILWLPIVFGLRLGFDFASPPLVAAPVALVALWWLPSVLRGARAALGPWRAVGSGAALLGTLAAALLPAHTARAPGWLNLAHVDAADGTARVVAEVHGSGLPPELAAAAPFERGPDGAGQRVFTADAGVWGAAPPELRRVENQDLAAPHAGWRVVRVNARSVRPARRLHLRLEGATTLLDVRWRGRELGPLEGQSFAFLGFGQEDLELTLGGPEGPLPLLVGDESWELPPALEALRAALPPTLVPRGAGDTSTVWARVEL